MDRRVKERLVGASILVVLIVLIVPELLSGPPGPAPARGSSGLPASAPEPVRTVTVDLATSKAPAPEPADAAASSAQPPETQSAAAASAAVRPSIGTGPSVTTGSGVNLARSPALPARTPPAPLETAEAPPTSVATAARAAAAGRAWSVQLGSFASRANADKLVRQLKGQGFSVYVLPGGTASSLRYRVRAGPMADRNAASQAATKL